MTDARQPTLEDVDRDGALTEAIAELCGSTRATFLKTAALGGAAMLAALATPSQAAARISDVGILNFALRFERMQATFYTQADEMGTIATMTARKQLWARTLGAHERAHVRIPLKRAQCRRLFAHDEPRNLGPCLAAATR